MNKFLICALLFLLSISAIAQKRLSDFEIKLLNFKYTLYEDLDKIDYQEIRSFDFLEAEKPLRKKVDDFIKQNKKEIVKYQKEILKKYEVFVIDTSCFEKDSLFLDFVEVYNTSAKEIGDRIGEFYKINPLIYINTIKNILISRKYSAAEIGRVTMINSIAWPKTATKEIGRNEFLLFFDDYHMAFLFKINVQDMKYEILGIYNRKA